VSTSGRRRIVAGGTPASAIGWSSKAGLATNEYGRAGLGLRPRW
jgi:hypothetical protein